LSRRVPPVEDLGLEEFDNIARYEAPSLRVNLIKAILGQTPILTLLAEPREAV